MTNQEKIQSIRFEFSNSLIQRCMDIGFDMTIAAIIADLIKSDVQQLAYESALLTKEKQEQSLMEKPKTETVVFQPAPESEKEGEE